MATASSQSPMSLVTTGVAGFDEIIGGGFTPKRIYLIEGTPGSGKTTLALQFLLEGVRRGERCLHITLSESSEELHDTAQSHGWSLDGITVFEVIPSEDSLTPENQYTMFHPSEVELGETTKLILAEVERVNPTRVIFDSLSELRLLAQNSLRYRRQLLALKQYFSGRNATVLFLDDRTSEPSDLQLHSIVHGVLSLEQLAPEYGGERRRLCINKLRGRSYSGGYHDYRIVRGGIEVYPRLIASNHPALFAAEQIQSSVSELDTLLGGGLERGTSVLFLGPAGVGKSSLATTYVTMAAERGEHVSIFLFDESIATHLRRSARLGMDLQPHIDSGRVRLQQINAAEISPGEFAHIIRRAVEQDASQLVVIDSLNGYMYAMPEERFLLLHLHELYTYLSQQGVITLTVVAQSGIIGPAMNSPVDVSYLADSVVLFRYFESEGRVRQAISVVKQRTGAHERTIRPFEFGQRGIRIDGPLHSFQGVLTGTPIYVGRPEALDESADQSS